ncbi:MAG: ATP-binding cassette domain-containing protein, partial [Candidatus Riflebacteria bacterium]
EVFCKKLDEITELFHTEDCLDLKCSAMSSGQKQKINIARALLHDPPIYIMDEPTLGLDVESLAGILDFILYQRQRGKTMLIVTHNMEMVHKLGGRVAFLVNGVIVNNVTVEEMMQNSGQKNLIDAYRYYAKA